MTSGKSKQEYKEYFEQNNLKGNNYETAMFIKFLMEKKSKGKEIEELTGKKHSQITSYKKIISSGKIEELREKSVSKVFKSIKKSPKLDKGIIIGIENLNLAGRDEGKTESEYDSEYDSEEEKIETWEESIEQMSKEFSNDYTDELELWIGDLESENGKLQEEIKKLKKKIAKDSKEEQQKTKRQLEARVEQQQKTIEELRNENASLLPYKKFFDEMKGKMDSVASGT